MYSARVQGCKSKMLVFTYQGETGEEVRSSCFIETREMILLKGMARGYSQILLAAVGIHLFDLKTNHRLIVPSL
jgi:hypothetical protein